MLAYTADVYSVLIYIYILKVLFNNKGKTKQFYKKIIVKLNFSEHIIHRKKKLMNSKIYLSTNY